MSVRITYPSVAGGTDYIFSRSAQMPFNIGDVGSAQVNVEGLGAVTYDVSVYLRGSEIQTLVQAAATDIDAVVVGGDTIVDGVVIQFSGPIATPVTVVITPRWRNA